MILYCLHQTFRRFGVPPFRFIRPPPVVRPVPLKLQAARALELSLPLSPSALFVLMQCESIPKRGRSRVFGIRWLQRPSTLEPLSLHRLALRDAITELAGCGLVRRVGRSQLICTTEGDLVKHCFNDLLADAKVNGALSPFTVDKVARAGALKLALRLYADGKAWQAIKEELNARR